MKTEELDRLIEEALTEEAHGAALHPEAWPARVAATHGRTAATPAARRLAIVAVAAAVLAAGIAVPLVLLSPLGGAPPDSDRAAPGQTANDLWGRTFVSTSVAENGSPRALVAGTTIEVTFERRDPRGVVRWNSGCNLYGSPVEIGAERLLVDDRAMSTTMGCEPPFHEQDDWLHAFFAADPYWVLDGETLRLTSANTLIELRERREPTEGGSTTYTDQDDGISITIPAEWTFLEDPSGPQGRIRTLFAVGTWNFPRGGDCAPAEALSQLPSDGVLFWINEDDPELSAIDPIPRRDHFDLDEAPFIEPGCAPVPFQYQWFTEHGRFLQVNVAYGVEASDAMREKVLRALDSMRLTAPVPGGCPVDYGPWSDRDCPDQAWVRTIVEEAGYEVTGDTGSALVAEADGVGFHIWSTSAQPSDETEGWAKTVEGYPPPILIDGTRVYVGEQTVQTVWTAQGHRIWVSPALTGPALTDHPVPMDVLADLVRSSKVVDYDTVDTR